MAKGNKKTKNFRKKRRLRVLYQLLSIVVVVVAIVAGCVLFFKVEEIAVIGSTKYSNEEILTVADVDASANLLLLPSSAIKERIGGAFPYVDQVQLRRSFPTTLEIVIEECVPMAVVESLDGFLYIIDANGKLLDLVGADDIVTGLYIEVDGLSLIEPVVGETAQVSVEDDVRLKGLCGLLNAIQKAGISNQITWIALSSGTEIEMDYEAGRFTVRMPVTPDGDDTISSFFERKMETLIALRAELSATDQGIIDLRYEKKAYFRPR